MIRKAMIKFRYEFQFQIPLQFYRAVGKVVMCDGNCQKLLQVQNLLEQRPESLKKGTFGVALHRNTLKQHYFGKKGTFWSNITRGSI